MDASPLQRGQPICGPLLAAEKIDNDAGDCSDSASIACSDNLLYKQVDASAVWAGALAHDTLFCVSLDADELGTTSRAQLG